MKKTPISLEERKRIQLGMLVEIDAFCRANNIKYMLAFGTLLGAIRHKGYIPWDDDVDICMPLDDMLRFKREFKSDKLKYCDVDTEKYYEYIFSRVSYKPTYNKSGLVCTSYGVNIDLYPILEVRSSMEENLKIVESLRPIYKKRWSKVKRRRKYTSFLPISTICGFESTLKRCRDEFFGSFSHKGGGSYYCICGPLSRITRHIYDYDLFAEMTEVDFEGYKMMAPASYHRYLTFHYGDYMQYPPEEERHPYHNHRGEYYWR